MDGKQLKNSILQWAIQGKLVPQNPKDEPASKLLERIVASRNGATACHPERNAVKSKDLKKKKSTPTSRIYRENGVWYEQLGNAEPKDISDDIPFEIPENWAWCRLGNVINLLSGRDFEPQFYNDKQNGIPYITGASNIGKNGIIINRWTPVPKCIANYGDLLLVCKGSGYGTLAYADFEKAHIARQIMSITVEPRSIFLKYVELVLQTNFQFLKGKGKGLIPGIDRETILNILAPLPPLAEQKRIVAKLEQVLPLADEYGAAQEQLDKLNKELPEALRKSILQQAIQGKLVPQNPKDEPAQKLLERITAARGENSQPKGAKSKKFSPTSRIYCENGTWYEQIGNAEPKDISEDIPFEIPKNWTWSRLGYIGETITGSTPSKLNSNYLGSDIPFLSPGDISQFNSITSYNNQGLSNLGKSVARPVPAQTILQVCIGGSIGKSAIVDREVCFNQQINSITLKDIDYRYVYYVLQSKFFQDSIKAKATGTATPIINKSSWDRLLFPVAPLAEQKRIVAKLEQLFKVL